MSITRNNKPQKIGLFFGTFDPIHNGHIHIAKKIKQLQNLDSVLILPLFDAPHKGETVHVNPVERFKMCTLACEELDGIDASPLEIEYEFKGYSMKMIDVVAELHPNDRLYYIIGSDVYLSILKWVSLELLIEKVTFSVALRAHKDLEAVLSIKEIIKQMGGQTVVSEFSIANHSSTEIRKCIRNQQSIQDKIPKVVEEYIHTKGLYT